MANDDDEMIMIEAVVVVVDRIVGSDRIESDS